MFSLLCLAPEKYMVLLNGYVVIVQKSYYQTKITMQQYTREEFLNKYGRDSYIFDLSRYASTSLQLKIIRAAGEIVNTFECGKNGDGLWGVYFGVDVSWWLEQKEVTKMMDFPQSWASVKSFEQVRSRINGSITKVYIFDNEEEMKSHFVNNKINLN